MYIPEIHCCLWIIAYNTVLGKSCRTRVSKSLAKTFQTLEDAEAHFQGLLEPGPTPCRGETAEIDTPEREAPEGVLTACIQHNSATLFASFVLLIFVECHIFMYMYMYIYLQALLILSHLIIH